MNAERLALLAERKALLRTRAELDRTRLAFAVAEIRSIVAPVRPPSRLAAVRPVATLLIGVLAPLFGARRISRWMRFISYGMTALRIVRGWRRGP